MKKILGIVAVILTVVAGVYYSKSNSSSANLKIGVIAGTTGEYAIVGENYIKGIELAKEQWMISHPDQSLNLIIENDEFDSKKALSAYQKLSSIDKVDAFINETTITVDATYDLIHQSGKPFVQGFEQSKPAEKDNIFQIWPSSVPAEVLLGKYIKEKGYKNVAVVVAQNIQAWNGFANAFAEGYGSNVTRIPVDSSSNDVRTDVLKIVNGNYDAVVLYTVPKQAALIVKESRIQSKTPLTFVFDQDIQTGEKEIKEILGSFTPLNGSIAMVTIGDNDSVDFVNAYKAKYGAEPGIGASVGYDSFNVLMRAYDRNINAWLKNIQNSNFQGASGEIKFNENGLRSPKVHIGEIVNGELPKGSF